MSVVHFGGDEVEVAGAANWEICAHGEVLRRRALDAHIFVKQGWRPRSHVAVDVLVSRARQRGDPPEELTSSFAADVAFGILYTGA